MKSLPEQSWNIRWKGVVRTFSEWSDLQNALQRGELSLIHEIEWQGKWWQIGDFLQKKPWGESEQEFVIPQQSDVVRTVHSLNEESVGERPAAKGVLPVELMMALTGTLAWLLLLILGSRTSWGLVLFVVAAVLPALWLILKGKKSWPWYGVVLLAGVAYCAMSATGWWQGV